MKLPNGRSAVLILALGYILAGCVTSKDPKFAAASAVPALGEGGHYQVYDRTDEGFTKGDEIDIKLRPDGRYDYVSPPNDAIQVSFHDVGGGRHVVQSKKGNNAPGYDYLVIQVVNGEVLTYAPNCEKQDKAKMTGVTIRKDECIIDGVADPAAFFAKLDLGGPTAKLVRE